MKFRCAFAALAAAPVLWVNIVSHAVLSLPTPFQRYAFDQPNVGVL